MKILTHDPVILIKKGLPLYFTVTAIFFSMYLIAQQELRLGADDQSVQIARDVAGALGEGIPVSSFASPRPVNMETSLSPYALIFDQDEKMLAGSAVLDGAIPRPPKGVFTYVKTHGEERVTWEPKSGVRQALVGVYHEGVNPGFVFAGRSLAEVERKIGALSQLAIMLWFFTLCAAFLLSALSA